MKYGIIELHDSYDFNTQIAPREVVMCGECKFCAHYTDGRIECRLWEHPLRIQYSEMKSDDFCSYGERKESE